METTRTKICPICNAESKTVRKYDDATLTSMGVLKFPLTRELKCICDECHILYGWRNL